MSQTTVFDLVDRLKDLAELKTVETKISDCLQSSVKMFALFLFWLIFSVFESLGRIFLDTYDNVQC